jgi:hypothetical protein
MSSGPRRATGPGRSSRRCARLGSTTVGPLLVRRRRTDVEHLDLAAGAYLLTAKLSLAQTSSHSTIVASGLRAGGLLDRSKVILGRTGMASGTTLEMMLGATLADRGTATVHCRYYFTAGQSRPRVRVSWIEISAVQLESLTKM